MLRWRPPFLPTILCLAFALAAPPAEAQTNDTAPGQSVAVEVGAKLPLQSEIHVQPHENFALHAGGLLQYFMLPGRSALIASALYRSPDPRDLTIRIGPTFMLFGEHVGAKFGIGDTLGVDYPLSDRLKAFADLSLTTWAGGSGGVHFINTGVGIAYRLTHE